MIEWGVDMDLHGLINIASFQPERLKFPDAWIGHIPFGAWLIQTTRPSVIVELGTHSGNSYFAFCQAVKQGRLPTRCFAVDTWKGDDHAGFYGEEIFQDVYLHNENNYSHFSRLLRMTFDEATQYFPDGSIDLLHIDGLHTYEAVKHDFENWLPKLANQAVVLLHDINVREREFGVWRLWQELCEKYLLNFEFIHSHGLGVTQLSKGEGSFDLEWLSPDHPHRIVTREYFTALGLWVREKYLKQEAKSTLNEHEQALRAELSASQEQRAALEAELTERRQALETLRVELNASQEQRASLEAEVAERGQALEALRAELSASQEQRAALVAELTERRQALETLRVELNASQEQRAALEAELADLGQSLEALRAELNASREQAVGLEAELTERGQANTALTLQKAALQQELDVAQSQSEQEKASLRSHMQQREQILQNLNSTLLEIYSSTAWKIIQRMWKVRLWLAPKGSWQEQFARRIINIRRSTVTGSKTNNLSLQHTEDQSNLPTADIKVEDSLPVISIIIPVYNALTMTKACVESLYLFTEGHDFEVIVIDNASEDGTFQWMNEKSKQLAKLNVIRMEKNIGFGPAVNIGLQSANGKYLVILNNDTVVSRGWLTNLISVLKNDSSVGIVSPVTNYVGEGPQIDPQAQNLQPTLESVAEYAQTINERSEVYYEPNRLVFFCVLLRRELVDLIGCLDEGYQKGNFEDDDYCLRTRAAGYRLAIARNTFVYHHGTVTFKMNQISHNQWMETNRNRFYQKAGRIATSIRPWSPSSTDPKVSVILRTKDRPKLLGKALTSLANQTCRDFEVVLVNDGGEDVSDFVSYFKPYFQITYIRHGSSKGRTAAINAGSQRVQGAWIAYLDDDDILYPWHFEALLKAAEQSSAGVIYGDYNKALFYKTEDNSPELLVGAPPWDYSRRDLLVENYLPIHTYIYLRKFVDELGPWNENLDRLEDYDFLLRLSGVTDFYHLRKVTCEYRYYLDCINTVFNGREGYLTALHKIYPQHPVDEDVLLIKRQQVVEGLQCQIKIIDELLQNAGTSKTEQMAAHREIFRIISGL